MKIWQSALLGLLQGLTEFIPVSSSGHLVLLQRYLHFKSEVPLLLEVSVHVGTLFAIFFAYRRELLGLSGYALISAPKKCVKEGFRAGLWEDARGRMIVLLALACVPTVIIGFLFKDFIERLFDSALHASLALITTGLILYSTRFIPEGSRERSKAGALNAVIIGLAQGFAIIPGISRSGSTISAGMWTGMKGRDAADFSFILSIPAIIGAFLLVVKDVRSFPIGEIPSITAGFFVALISGYLSLRFLLKYIRKGGIHKFAWYCWFIGAASLAGYYFL